MGHVRPSWHNLRVPRSAARGRAKEEILDQAQRREILAAKIYASTHDLRMAEEALVELGELTQAQAGTLFERRGFP